MRHLALWLTLGLVGAAGAAPPRVALTFDDGPNPAFGPKALELLDRHGAKATFFVIGRHIARAPRQVGEYARRGHEVENHTWNHPKLTNLSPAAIQAEARRTSERIAQLTGRRPLYLRPPYGAYDARVRQAAAAVSLKLALWSVDPLDWQTSATAARTTKRVLDRLAPNAVILLHECPTTLAALPAILEGLRARGYEAVTYDTLQRRPSAQPPAPEPVAERAATLDFVAPPAEAAGRGLSIALAAAEPPGWEATERLRFKLVVPDHAPASLLLKLRADPLRPHGGLQVSVNELAVGTFYGGFEIVFPLSAEDTAEGLLHLTVTGVDGTRPAVDSLDYRPLPPPSQPPEA